MEPTAAQIASFIAFIRGVMGVDSTVLPDASPVIVYSLTGAINVVNPVIGTLSPFLFEMALNNLAADNLIRWAQDTSPATFWIELRKSFGMNAFAAGVVQSSGDEGTNTSLLVPDFLKSLTMGNLMNMATPYGRQYLAIAQDFGTLWGLS